jgi:hypothetical protein
VGKRARPGLERIEVAPVLPEAVLHRLRGKDDLLVEEEPVGLLVDRGLDLRSQALHGLDAMRLLNARAEVDDDQVGVRGEVGRRPARRVLHAPNCTACDLDGKAVLFSGTANLLPDSIVVRKSGRVGAAGVTKGKIQPCA